ncbi:double zinc ribbon and ankyrin repeat-containing protein 1-like isoform X2 [Branchiostoma floridae]|uniref:Double zinc ribbon and ankyrin repeat-containing protein 1 n=1 Tax=Branchiostoma floridae TaxID=7739 RepID=A0A9J7N4S4_BRAFL|nr:double zinc ribbon and ankyrin repeat-containing protein 1-like isoform X2 [Branchiostoma floridae]
MTAGAICPPTIVPLRLPVPGKTKLWIDTNTRIELKSDTPDTTFWYTVDGTRPDPFKQLGEKTTLKYREAFTLPEGKIAVKALALSRDGRESSVVTKTFQVDYVAPPPLPRDEDDQENFQRDLERDRRKKQGTSKKAAERSKDRLSKETARKESHNLIGKILQKTLQEGGDASAHMGDLRIEDLTLDGSDYRRPQTKTRFLHSRMGPTVDPGKMSDHPENLSHAKRLQRETDFLSCIYCMAPRPSDPYARYCNDCGSPVPPVPGSRLPPPEGGQMGMCVYCKSMVPLNTPTCLVCEAPIPPQLQPQASVVLAGKRVCPACSTANPADLDRCVMCETRLPPMGKPIAHGGMHPVAPKPDPHGRLMTCSKCGRVNNPDARFCDWCGTKASDSAVFGRWCCGPSPPVMHVTCGKCKSSNQAYARYCLSCGTLLEPPFRNDPRNTAKMVPGSQFLDRSVSGSWVPISLPVSPPKAPPSSTVATQTVGLFYPSFREMQQREMREAEEREKAEKMSDKRPPVSAVSPGKGYWRKQIDHICGHLRAYAQNTTEFRANVGEPRMGKLVSATVHEDGYELSLAMTFALRGNKDVLTGKPMRVRGDEFLSNLTEGRRRSFHGSSSSLASDSSEKKKKKGTKKPKKKKQPNKEDKLHPEDRLLLQEVGSKGDGNTEEVQKLLDEGADPNLVDNDDRPVLTVAVMNNRHESIPVLVQAGAEVDKRSGPKNNTALHEAVNLGPSGKRAVQALLGCNANSKRKNDKGETPYDLAVKMGDENILKSFASSMGQDLLDKMTKPGKAADVQVDVF